MTKPKTLALYFIFCTTPLALVIVGIIKLPIAIEFRIVLTLITLFLIGVLWWNCEQILDAILTEGYKKRINFFRVRWKSKDFDEFVGSDLVTLKEDGDYLVRHFKKNPDQLSDYSFIVLPLAKAYEGVLKKILVRTGIVTESELLANPDLAINKYFNPIGNSKIFSSLKDEARDKAIPHVIYSTYQECRNQIFHYDPYRDNKLKTIEEAEFYSRRIIDAIYKAYFTFRKD